MSFLLSKSEQNKQAFFYLIDKDVRAASVHCAYYSCIQKIIYILQEYYTEEYKKGLEALKGGHGNKHRFYIEEVASRLSKDIRKNRDFRKLLVELRNLRIEADYHDTEVTDERINIVKSYFEEIQKEMRQNFHL